MQPLIAVTGQAVPLRRENVDTDQIIPAEFLKRVEKFGFADALFSRWRADPDFELNRPEYQHPLILVAGRDFGTGSSREHAVWALRDFGFRVVISPRFGDIFRGNAGKQGILAAVVAEDDVEALQHAIEADPSVPVSVDLAARTVTRAELTVPFEVDDYVRWRLMEGLDDIDLTLRNEDAITRFEATRASWRPKTLPARS